MDYSNTRRKKKVIAGSVFTLKINSDLACQALASAIGFKENSPICRSCKFLFTDNGSEMKNRYLTISKQTKKIIIKKKKILHTSILKIFVQHLI